MKRYVYSATAKRPTTISRTKLRRATYFKENESLETFCTDAELASASDSASAIRSRGSGIFSLYGVQYLDESVWASDHNLSARDLKELNLSYIIDTEGHINFVSLPDNEDMQDMEYISLKSAIQSTIRSICSDLHKYNGRKNVVRGHITISIFGYGNYSLKYEGDLYCLDNWGKNLTYIENQFKNAYLECADGHGGLSVPDIIADNTYFKRRLMPRINKLLAEPLSNL